MAVMEQEEIQYKLKKESKTQISKNIQQDYKESSSNKIKQKMEEEDKDLIQEKGIFEKVFEINRYSEITELIENFNLSKVNEFVDSALNNPDNTIIILINPRKSLMEMLDNNNSDKTNNLPYDFKLTKIYKMWDIITELSKNIRDRSIECNAFDIHLKSPLKVISKIKIFFAGKNLEFLFDITSPINDENKDEFFLPIIERCMKFNTKREELDLFECLKQLKNALESNETLFPENQKDFYHNKNTFYTKNSKIPEFNFYRIIFFNGTITEKIEENDFDNFLIRFKKSFNIVFNYFNYEYDYQLEKKVYKIFHRNELMDFKFDDFKFFLKPENPEFELISNYKEKIGYIETFISSSFLSFYKIKNYFFHNDEFIKFAENYEKEHKKLLDDYNIIKVNYRKFMNKKSNFCQVELNHIKKNFEEMLKKNVIRSHLYEIKEKIDFKKLKNIINNTTFEVNTKINKLKKDLNRDMENIVNMSNFSSYFFLNFL